MGVEVEVSVDCDPAKVLMSLLNSQDGVNDEDMKPWAVIVDAPHAAYLEFGTGPTTKSRGQNPDGRSEVMDRFIAWAVARGWGPWAGKAMYEYAMKKGTLPNPYLRPAMYSVIEDLEGGLWVKEYSPRAVSEEIAERAKRIVTDYHMGAGDLTDGTHLRDLIGAEPADRSVIMLHPDLTQEHYWTEGGQWSGVHGKTASTRPRTR